MPPQTGQAGVAGVVDPDALAKQFGGTVVTGQSAPAPAPTKPSTTKPAPSGSSAGSGISLTITGDSATPAPAAAPTSAVDPDALAKQLGGTVVSNAPAPPPLGQAKGIEARPSSTSGKLINELIESLPMLGGAAGGAAGFVLGAPTAAVSGPAGPYVATTGGAFAGGALGTALRDFLRSTVKIDDVKQPAFEPRRTLASAGREGSSQMVQEATGQGGAAIIGGLMRGGFLRKSITPEVARTIQENKQYGINLSGPEQMAGTRAGRLGSKVQLVAAGTPSGGELEITKRMAGDQAATQRLDAELRKLAAPLSREQAGRAVEAGVGGAVTARQQIGSNMRQLASKAPRVDITPIKSEVQRVFETELLPFLKDFPDKAGSAAPLIRRLKADPTLIQRDPRPIMTALADGILEQARLDKKTAPFLKTVKEILGAEDSVLFQSAADFRTQLREAAGDEMLRTRGEGISKKFEQLFSDTMGPLSPAWERASKQYANASRIVEAPPLQSIITKASSEPEVVLNYLKDDTVTRAKLLRQALLGTAAQGPDAARAAQAYEQIRSSWWQDQIVQGGKPTPDLAGMAKRIADASYSGVLPAMFGDAKGRELVRHGRAIAELIAKRNPQVEGNLRLVFQAGRVLTGVAAAATSGATAGLGTAGVLEGGPFLLTWAMYNPKATQWLIEGATATNPTTAASAGVRLMELLRQDLMSSDNLPSYDQPSNTATSPEPARQ